MRTGAFSGGSGEEALVIAAAAQICNHYGLITSMPSGMSDSKLMDAQAGYEKGITTLAAALVSWRPGRGARPSPRRTPGPSICCSATW